MTEPTEPIEAVIARLREKRPHWSEAVWDDIYRASEIDADLSRLLDYVEGMRWRPIDSAPRDEDVLLFDPSADFWPLLARWEDEECFEPGWYTPTAHQVFEPTHWMPLPPPPLHGKG